MAREKDNIALSDEHNSRGIELADRGWLDEAIREFKKAIDLDPDSAHAHDNLATVYAEKKLYREALGRVPHRAEARAGQRHGALQPGLLPLHPRAGVRGRRLQAGHRARPGVPGRAPQPRPHLRRPRTGGGGDHRAADAPSSSTRPTPSPATSWRRCSWTRATTADAIAQLKEVVRLEPENFEAHLDLGICYAQKGFYAEAERAYEKARALNAEDLLLHYNLAALYALWGKKPEALSWPEEGAGGWTGRR